MENIRNIMHSHESAIDVILTNCKYNFMHLKASEKGLSDFHKMVCFYAKYLQPSRSR